jgi:hypothetical protein
MSCWQVRFCITCCFGVGNEEIQHRCVLSMPFNVLTVATVSWYAADDVINSANFSYLPPGEDSESGTLDNETGALLPGSSRL